MDHNEVGKCWDDNAEAWTRLARMGYDVYRDELNTPAFLGMLPDVDGLKGVDIGCGEGNNTRKVAGLGAKMRAIDISSVFIGHAKEAEEREPMGIEYQVASAVELPFADGSFDFAMATMSFMDMPEIEKVICETRRVLRPGGFLQFSISHPCFSTPKFEWIRDEDGKQVAILCGDYFRQLNGETEEWTFGAAPEEIREKYDKFKVPRFTRTLSEWLNLLIDNGFVLEEFAEPTVDDETAKRIPYLADTQIVAYFLIIRGRVA